jgi:hypothetical protein
MGWRLGIAHLLGTAISHQRSAISSKDGHQQAACKCWVVLVSRVRFATLGFLLKTDRWTLIVDRSGECLPAEKGV